jgi:hypothetical protein
MRNLRPSDPGPRGSSGSPRATLAVIGWPALGLLTLEFVLGMALNLYTTVPTGPTLGIFESSPVLDFHLVAGILLVGIMARAFGLSFRDPGTTVRVAGSVGLASTIIAFLSGLAFVFGGQSALASLTMSLGFVGAFMAAAVFVAFGTASSSVRQEREMSPRPRRVEGP